MDVIKQWTKALRLQTENQTKSRHMLYTGDTPKT